MEEVQEIVELLLTALRADTVATDFTPVGDRVLCYSVEGERTQKRGDLWVVSEDNVKTCYYVVIADPDAELPYGTTIIAGQHVGHPVDLLGEHYRLIPRQDILAYLASE